MIVNGKIAIRRIGSRILIPHEELVRVAGRDQEIAASSLARNIMASNAATKKAATTSRKSTPNKTTAEYKAAKAFIEETKRQHLAGKLSKRQVAVVEERFPDWKQRAADTAIEFLQSNKVQKFVAGSAGL
jgi:DNA-binding transcriptional regulator YbjK